MLLETSNNVAGMTVPNEVVTGDWPVAVSTKVAMPVDGFQVMLSV